MAAAQTTARRNGTGRPGRLRPVPDPPEREAAGTEPPPSTPSFLRRAVAAGASRLGALAPGTPSLEDRDPDAVRTALPRLWLAASVWFRSEVRGMGNLPDLGPVVLLGNRSGGPLSPDTMVFALAFSTYFGAERRFHPLVDAPALTAPGIGLLRGFGVLPPSPANLRAALAAGAAALVYPGGATEGSRPSWRDAQLRLGEDRDAIAAAIETGVPIVPVVSIGAQESALFLGRPAGLPLPPFPALPLPAKITIEVLAPVDPVAEFGPSPDPEAVHAHVEQMMREALALLAEERRLPVLG